MNFNEYQQVTARTANAISHEEGLLNWTLGISGEAGEIAELVKKHRFHGHDWDQARAIDELGDLLWYVARFAATIGADLESVARGNLAKLRARYPDGFSSERSREREG